MGFGGRYSSWGTLALGWEKIRPDFGLQRSFYLMHLPAVAEWLMQFDAAQHVLK
jgi:hypothetical protein